MNIWQFSLFKKFISRVNREKNYLNGNRMVVLKNENNI